MTRRGTVGAPGERDYTPDYYAAFLRDPDGNKLEAVHLPEVPFPDRGGASRERRSVRPGRWA